ncbi:PfkB family carbohydrate kinase [Cellulomonas sp. NPDC055163]
MSFDPNIRTDVCGSRGDAREAVERCVGLSDVVKASSEDVEWLYPGSTLDDVASLWLGLGPALVVLTLGAQGCLTATRDGVRRLAARPAHVVDTVGAGDSFMAGLLDGLAAADLLGVDRRADLYAAPTERLQSAVTWASRAAEVTVSRAGADLPGAAELRRISHSINRAEAPAQRTSNTYERSTS